MLILDFHWHISCISPMFSAIPLHPPWNVQFHQLTAELPPPQPQMSFLCPPVLGSTTRWYKTALAPRTSTLVNHFDLWPSVFQVRVRSGDVPASKDALRSVVITCSGSRKRSFSHSLCRSRNFRTPDQTRDFIRLLDAKEGASSRAYRPRKGVEPAPAIYSCGRCVAHHGSTCSGCCRVCQSEWGQGSSQKRRSFLCFLFIGRPKRIIDNRPRKLSGNHPGCTIHRQSRPRCTARKLGLGHL